MSHAVLSLLLLIGFSALQIGIIILIVYLIVKRIKGK